MSSYMSIFDPISFKIPETHDNNPDLGDAVLKIKHGRDYGEITIYLPKANIHTLMNGLISEYYKYCDRHPKLESKTSVSIDKEILSEPTLNNSEEDSNETNR